MIGELAAAAKARDAVADVDPRTRGEWLCAIAERFDSWVEDLVKFAEQETHLSPDRLRGEVARTTNQLRFFAEVLEDGHYLEAMIDHADPAASPPRPDLRRMMHPLGPVAVFSASNFPFAFSVAGGDTASALAAGCPVIVKAHSGHPRLSEACARLVREALSATGAPAGAFGMVSGREIGRELVRHPTIAAVAFTGSLAGGRALQEIAASRPDPVPFYGEFGSLNPVVITPGAASRRRGELADGLVASFTMGGGQFCTKPGYVFVPADSALVEAVATRTSRVEPVRLLTSRIAEDYSHGVATLLDREGFSVAAGSPEAHPTGAIGPLVLATDAETLIRDPQVTLMECFGPVTIMVRYRSLENLCSVLSVMPGSLTATLHSEPDEDVVALLPLLRHRAGRLLFDGWPTGVSVSWAQHHGGPWPATSAPHTSVGATAVRRFLRPITWQSAPEELLPLALHDSNPLGLPRRVNGVVVPAP